MTKRLKQQKKRRNPLRLREITLGLTIILCSTARGEEAQPVFSGVIEGQVLNLDGSIIPRAEVWTIPIGTPNQGTLPRTQANDQGQFSVRIQKPGRYLIAAWQEKEGYANSLFRGYGVPVLPPPEVLIDKSQTKQWVVVRIGPKLGRLTGTVLDAETHRRVEKGQVEVRVRSGDNALVRQSPYSKGEFHFSVPPRLFNLRVSAPGYQDWYGNGSREQPEFFAVELGHDREIAVLLQPLASR